MYMLYFGFKFDSFSAYIRDESVPIPGDANEQWCTNNESISDMTKTKQANTSLSQVLYNFLKR